jgi:hypothetical protein
MFKNHDKSHPRHYTSDDKYIGSFLYWKDKYGDKFDDFTYEKWEVLSKVEDEKLKEKLLNEIKQREDEHREEMNYLVKQMLEDNQKEFMDNLVEQMVDLNNR